MDKREIANKVNQWEEVRWRREIENRSSIESYRLKNGIGGCDFYDNRWESVLLFRARSNTLRLGWRERFVGGGVGCVMCGAEEENLEHFLVRCERLRGLRERYGVESVGDALGFGGIEIEVVKRYIRDAWSERGRLVGSA